MFSRQLHRFCPFSQFVRYRGGGADLFKIDPVMHKQMQMKSTYADPYKFFKAVQSGQIEKEEILNYEHKPKFVDYVCEHGSPDIFEFLVLNDVEINNQNIMTLFTYGNEELLIECGKSTDLSFAYSMASVYDRVNVIDHLKLNNVKIPLSTLNTACRVGHIDIVKKLLENNVFCLAEAIIVTCKHNQPEIAEILLSKAIECPSNAMEVACEYGNIRIVEILLAEGIKGDHDAFVQACRNGYTDIVKLLLDNNVKYPPYALNIACSNSRKEVVELLLGQESNKRIRDYKEGKPIILEHIH